MKSELSQTFVVLTGLLLLETGCAGHRTISASKPAANAADSSVVASQPGSAAATNDPASASDNATATNGSAKKPGRETLVANASPATVGNVVTVPPPPPQVEVVGAAPGPEYAWMPGIWTWQGNWVWISGRWVQRPRPEARWVTGHWTQHVNGWAWVRGYWR